MVKYLILLIIDTAKPITKYCRLAATDPSTDWFHICDVS